jgi:hypothetical protein
VKEINMKHPVTVPSIPPALALRLCTDIRTENEGKLFTWAAWRCWGCVESAHGDPQKMYFACQPDCRGCPMVNVRYYLLVESGGSK